ncbi:cardiolipin synthase [bacterium]|nr:cardiolipin synthase [bacterium]
MLWQALWVILPVLHALGLLAALHAILKSSTPQGAIAWSLALVAFPVVVLPFYLLFGSTHFEGYVNPLRAGSLVQTKLMVSALQALSKYRPREGHAQLKLLEQLSRTPFTGSNSVELLIDGNTAYRRMQQEIEKAQDYLLVLFYKVVNDSSGRALKNLLIEKARQGVRVYFVFDELGSRTIQGAFLREMRQAGIETWPFRTARGWRHSLQWNFRNHRKIVVVDGKLALVGGLNIADKYLGLSPYYGPWRDTHTVLQGPAVLGVQLAFCEDYYWATRGKIPDLHWTPQAATDGQLACTYLTSGPVDSRPVGVMFYLECIHSARQRLWLASPYFAPDPSIMNALKMADMRGVDVKILIPPGRYEPHMRLAALSFLPDLKGTGIQLYEYPAYNHSKVMLVDDWLSWVGSSNLDNRSLRLNFEGNLMVTGREFAAQMQDMLERDFAVARLLDFDAMGRFGLMTRLGTKVARLFLPVI